MANFDEAVQAISDGKIVRRDGWGEGSTMYADANGQLMRTPNHGSVFGEDYSWALDVSDITAKDWHVL